MDDPVAELERALYEKAAKPLEARREQTLLRDKSQRDHEYLRHVRRLLARVEPVARPTCTPGDLLAEFRRIQAKAGAAALRAEAARYLHELLDRARVNGNKSVSIKVMVAFRAFRAWGLTLDEKLPALLNEIDAAQVEHHQHRQRPWCAGPKLRKDLQIEEIRPAWGEFCERFLADPCAFRSRALAKLADVVPKLGRHPELDGDVLRLLSKLGKKNWLSLGIAAGAVVPLSQQACQHVAMLLRSRLYQPASRRFNPFGERCGVDQVLFFRLLQTKAGVLLMSSTAMRKGDLMRCPLSAISLEPLALGNPKLVITFTNRKKQDKSLRSNASMGDIGLAPSYAFAGFHVNPLRCPIAHLAMLLTYAASLGLAQDQADFSSAERVGEVWPLSLGSNRGALAFRGDRQAEARFTAVFDLSAVLFGFNVGRWKAKGHICRSLCATTLADAQASPEEVDRHCDWATRTVSSRHYVHQKAGNLCEKTVRIMQGLAADSMGDAGASVPLLRVARAVKLPTRFQDACMPWVETALAEDHTSATLRTLQTLKRVAALSFVLIDPGRRHELGYDYWASIAFPGVPKSEWRALQAAASQAVAAEGRGQPETLSGAKRKLAAARRRIQELERKQHLLEAIVRERRLASANATAKRQCVEVIVPPGAEHVAALTPELKDRLRRHILGIVYDVERVEEAGLEALTVPDMSYKAVFAKSSALGGRSVLGLLTALSRARNCTGSKASDLGISYSAHKGRQWRHVLLLAGAVKLAGSPEALREALLADPAVRLGRKRNWLGLVRDRDCFAPLASLEISCLASFKASLQRGKGGAAGLAL